MALNLHRESVMHYLIHEKKNELCNITTEMTIQSGYLVILEIQLPTFSKELGIGHMTWDFISKNDDSIDAPVKGAETPPTRTPT